MLIKYSNGLKIIYTEQATGTIGRRSLRCLRTWTFLDTGDSCREWSARTSTGKGIARSVGRCTTMRVWAKTRLASPVPAGTPPTTNMLTILCKTTIIDMANKPCSISTLVYKKLTPKLTPKTPISIPPPSSIPPSGPLLFIYSYQLLSFLYPASTPTTKSAMAKAGFLIPFLTVSYIIQIYTNYYIHIYTII